MEESGLYRCLESYLRPIRHLLSAGRADSILSSCMDAPHGMHYLALTGTQVGGGDLCGSKDEYTQLPHNGPDLYIRPYCGNCQKTCDSTEHLCLQCIVIDA